MRLDILNLNKAAADLPEVTHPNLYNTNTMEPHDDGLLSYKIFGKPGSRERRLQFAYIDLHDKFFHPHVMYELNRYKRNLFDECMRQTKDFTIVAGELKRADDVKNPTKVGRGMDWLYKNWELLDFKPKADDAPTTKTRKKFLGNLSRDEIFITKWIVIPAFYRDVKIKGGKKNEMNSQYNRILNNVSSLAASSAIGVIFGWTPAHTKIQDTIMEMYQDFVTIIGGSKGFLHRNVFGKNTDFSSRNVVTTPKFDMDDVSKSEVSFSHAAIPLASCVKCFAPFIKYGMKRFVENVLAGNRFLTIVKPSGKIERVEITADFKSVYSSETVDKLISLYYDSMEHRFDTFNVPTIDGPQPLLWIRNEPDENGVIDVKTTDVEDIDKVHPITLLELFYIVAHQQVRDKHVYITRFPIENMNSMYPAGMNIIPCIKYRKVILNGDEYPRFPIIDKKISPRGSFDDSLKVFPSYLASLGADFDGDICSIQGVFTDEANEEAERYIHSKSNIISPAGDIIRKFSETSSLGMYSLTYRNKRLEST